MTHCKKLPQIRPRTAQTPVSPWMILLPNRASFPDRIWRLTLTVAVVWFVCAPHSFGALSGPGGTATVSVYDQGCRDDSGHQTDHLDCACACSCGQPPGPSSASFEAPGASAALLIPPANSAAPSPVRDAPPARPYRLNTSQYVFCS